MHQRYLSYCFFTFLSVIGTCMIFNALVDPLQYYRRNSSYPLCENDRWQVAAFVHNFPYDTAVLGTSLTQNLSLSKIKKKLGGTPIRFSVAGATIPEQLLVLESAVKSGKLKKLIWGIDRYYFYFPDKKDSMPSWLYKRSFVGHMRYLLNVDTLAQSLRILSSRSPVNEQEALESYNSWWPKATCSKQVVLKIYEHELSRGQGTIKPQKNQKKHILSNILGLIRRHPEVEFILFLPPYSLAYHKRQHQIDKTGFENDFEFRRFMLQELVKLKNVKIYDLETNLNIITNLDNYKDLNHFGKNASDAVIDCIGNQDCLISERNLEISQANFQKLPYQEFR